MRLSSETDSVLTTVPSDKINFKRVDNRQCDFWIACIIKCKEAVFVRQF
jgi:hypothetical protein